VFSPFSFSHYIVIIFCLVFVNEGFHYRYR